MLQWLLYSYFRFLFTLNTHSMSVEITSIPTKIADKPTLLSLRTLFTANQLRKKWLAAIRKRNSIIMNLETIPLFFEARSVFILFTPFAMASWTQAHLENLHSLHSYLFHFTKIYIFIISAFFKSEKLDPVCLSSFNDARECMFKSDGNLYNCKTWINQFKHCQSNPTSFVEFLEASTAA